MSPHTDVVLKNINGFTKATTLRNQKPIKILTPKSHNYNYHLVTTNYGGGLVQGDTVNIKIKANPNTICALTSQANNRVYKSESGKNCSIHQEIEIKENSLFFMLNDPLVLQKKSNLKQYFKCNLHRKSNFVMLDWVSLGRIKSNEILEFDEFYSESEIIYDDKKILLDKFSLKPSKNNCKSPGIFKNHTTFINLYIVGSPKKCLIIVSHLKNVINKWLITETKPNPKFIVSIDTINTNLHILRASAIATFILWEFVKEITTIFSNKNLLDFNPYERKY